VLTRNHAAGPRVTLRRIAPAGTAIGLWLAMLAMPSPADADGLVVGGCAGFRGTFNCTVRWGQPADPYVRVIPQPLSETEIARAQERDREWRDHCHPAVATDRYGVARYQYAERGCEYGSGAN
jgi:hypothetical protein